MLDAETAAILRVVLNEVCADISPFGTEGSQTMLARCVVPNLNGDLRPGRRSPSSLLDQTVTNRPRMSL